MFHIMNPLLWSFEPVMPERVFFAILPPSYLWPVIGKLSEGVRRAHALDGRPIGLERLHITLALVSDGWFDTAPAVRRAIAVGDAMAGPVFSARLELTTSFRNPRRKPFVLSANGGLADLIAFRAALRQRMLLAGFDVPADFTPHLTLVWADRCVEEEYPIAPISWEVRDFALIRSYHGLSRYEIIRRWPLQSLGQRADRQISDMGAIARSVPAAGLDQLVPQRRGGQTVEDVGGGAG